LVGVELSVEPASVSIEPGQSADLTLTLELDPAALGAPGPGPHTAPAMFDMPRHYLTEVSAQLVLSDSAAQPGQARPLSLPIYANVRAADERVAGEPFRCEQGAGSVFIPTQGITNHPQPLVSAYVLGTVDDEDVDPAQNPDGAALDIRAVGATSDYGIHASVDELSLHFGVAVGGTWTTPARGTYSLLIIDIDVDGNSSGDYWIVAEPFRSDPPFADALAATTYDLTSGQPLLTKRYLNLVPADQASTQPFNNGVLAFSVFGRDLGMTQSASSIRYRVLSVSIATGFQFDDTPWVTFDPTKSVIDPSSGSAFPGRPLYRGNEPILLSVDETATELPELLLLHHTNVEGMRWQVLDPTPTAVEQVRVEHDFPTQANRGERLTSHIDVTNDGAVEMASARLEGTIRGASLDLAAPSQGSCAKGDTLDCDLGSLPAGASVRITVALDALGAGPVELDAHLTSANGCITAVAGSVDVGASNAPPPTLVSAGGCGCELARRDDDAEPWLWLLLGAVAFAARGARRHKT
jgi:hypothetical protein